MRMSHLFSQTLRQDPVEAEAASHKLLIRAGYIRQVSSGIFAYLPLAQRTLTKIKQIIQEEIQAIKGQEITLPVIQPTEIWEESKEQYRFTLSKISFQDRHDRAIVLGYAYERIIMSLIAKEIHSWRQLPILLYQIQTQWQDDPHPSMGLGRLREFTRKDSYSLDRDEQGLEYQYQAHHQAYMNIFKKCSLPVNIVESANGMEGKDLTHDFRYITPIGNKNLIQCQSCSYKAPSQTAKIQKKTLPQEQLQPLEKVHTPEIKTIAALSEFLRIPPSRTAKAVFYIATGFSQGKEQRRFIFVIIRGDMEVNEYKLASLIQAHELRSAIEKEVMAVGAVPGYASPIGLQNIFVVVDEAIPESPNLAAGANDPGYHYCNVNFPRDFSADLIADITTARAGDPCPNCSKPLSLKASLQVGKSKKMGTHYKNQTNCSYLNHQGKRKPIFIGFYWLGCERLMACIAEEHHDNDGLIWPLSVAPYQIYLVTIPAKDKSDTIFNLAEQMYHDLISQGLEVLFDDREEKPGVKFKDADLIGIPIRITISPRSLEQGGVELKFRTKKERQIIAVDTIVAMMVSETEKMRNQT